MATSSMSQLERTESKLPNLHIKYIYGNPVILNRYHKRILADKLSGWFCFVQTDDGKVVAVQHAPNDSDDTVNFKKAIAAAFQANFKQTPSEEETDIQSHHNAHYRYCNARLIIILC